MAVLRRAETGDEDLIQNIRAVMSDKEVVLKENRSEERETELQNFAKEWLEEQGMDYDASSLNVIEVKDSSMKEDPETKYRTDKTLMMETYDRGEIQLMEKTCTDLLAVKPHDAEVWRMRTLGRLRLKLWDSALESARRWIAFEPQALNPRCAEAFAQAGSQESTQVKEARVRFAQLYKEVNKLEGEGIRDAAVELQECVWRCDEMLEHKEAEAAVAEEACRPCNLSARPATVLTGARPPHFFLPNFADSVGPVKVVQADKEELGGGAVHSRKLIVTKDVQAGEPLFVQNAMAFASLDRAGDVVRLKTSLVTAATLSPRQAKLVDILLDRSEWDDSKSDEVMEALRDPTVVREKPWSSEPDDMVKHFQACEELVLQAQVLTGKKYSGIWMLPALARHSCAPSANHTIWGDVLMARAARPLKAGDEVTLGLFELWFPLEMRQDKFTHTGPGFWCRCPRCEAEANFDPRAVEAAADLEARFQQQGSRIQAVMETLDLKLEERKKELEKEYDAIRAGAQVDNEKLNKEMDEGLLGLADRFKSLKGAPTDADIEELRKYFPERNEPELVDVKPDLVNDLLDAVETFEMEVDTLDMPEEHRHWLVSNHLGQYGQLITLLRLRKDVEAQRRVVDRLLDAVATTLPGCFQHQKLSVLLWEVAALCADPTLKQKVMDLIPKELERVRDAIKVRYGEDLDDAEIAAALARISATTVLDENWMWDITWCSGRNPGIEPVRGPSGKVLPVLGSSILV
ncbi:unnamed protein product [Effrenium voratum]|uniref:SET domain-containing protein n=1 Tax=Effrenium voratum TaxID=2562239 RepID=A0AA36J9R6_9DINO|nr:unnamed protein product [Effrenium voratum]